MPFASKPLSPITAALTTGVALGFAVGPLPGCQTRPVAQSEVDLLEAESQAVVQRIKSEYPSINRFFDTAAGYAVFPTIAKGSFIVGGAFGEGLVYENDTKIGYSTLSQGSIGLQIGGEGFSEIIFFETAADLDAFTAGNFEFGAQASAVALTAGASSDASFNQGLAVFTLAKGGLAAGVSLGGQNFTYRDLDRALAREAVAQTN